MSGNNLENGEQAGPVETWRSISLMVLQHGQQNCDLTVRTMRHISDETLDERRAALLDEALAALRQQLEDQHHKIQMIISGFKTGP